VKLKWFKFLFAIMYKTVPKYKLYDNDLFIWIVSD
jgi:hypothetical protein